MGWFTGTPDPSPDPSSPDPATVEKQTPWHKKKPGDREPAQSEEKHGLLDWLNDPLDDKKDDKKSSWW